MKHSLLKMLDDDRVHILTTEVAPGMTAALDFIDRITNTKERHALMREIDALQAEVDNLPSEQATMNASYDELVTERDALQVERDDMERDMLQLKADTTAEINRLQASLGDVRRQHTNQMMTIRVLSDRCDELANVIAKLRVTLSSLPGAPKP